MSIIEYHEIKKFEFKEILTHDRNFEKQYGYPYKIFFKKLSNTFELNWDQSTRKCTLIKIEYPGFPRIIFDAEVSSVYELSFIINTFKKLKL